MLTRAFCLACIVFCAAGVFANSIFVDTGHHQPSETAFGVVQVRTDGEGFAAFGVEGVSWINRSGQPQLPWKTITVLLPPNADISTVSCRLEDADYETIDGCWNVRPVPPMASRDKDGNPVIVWPEGANIVDGRDIDIYGLDVFWPVQRVLLQGTGKLRGWQLAEVAVPLAIYNPTTGQIALLAKANVKVDYSKKGQSPVEFARGRGVINQKPEKPDAIGRERVRNFAANFGLAAADYDADLDTEPAAAEGQDAVSTVETAVTSLPAAAAGDGDIAPASPNQSNTGFVIITTNAIQSSSMRLASFVTHKQSQGFTVEVVTEGTWGGGTGDTAATNIRGWLKANYISKKILYVLLIGNPDPTTPDPTTGVPMKMCIKNPRDPNDPGHPTDYFYAELTANWDSNGNGIYGEDGEVEKYFEVYTGRIPYYGAVGDTDAILKKIMDYENTADKTWRRNVLLPMVPLDDRTQSFQCGEQIKYNILEPEGIPSVRMYSQNYGLIPPPEYLFSEAYPATVWGQGRYGMVIWSTHGWQTGASGVIKSGEVSGLNNDYPSACWQGSCQNGWPEDSGNLGYSLLKRGAVGTVAGSRNGWYYVGESDYTNSSTAAGLGYQYAKRLVEGKTFGQALFDTKEAMGFWLKNYYVYNLYGDPSVKVYPLPEPKFFITPTHGLYEIYLYGTLPSFMSGTIKLTNNSDASLNWTATENAAWFDTSLSSGTIAAGGTATVSVQLTAEAGNLLPGTYEETIIFTDTTNSITCNAKVALIIEPMRMIAHWKLDESAGTTAADSSDTGCNGTLKKDAAAAAWSFGTSGKLARFGNGLDFNNGSTGNFIEVSNLELTSNRVTISAWLKTSGIESEYTGIVSCRTAAAQNFNFKTNNRLGYHWNDQQYGWDSQLTVPDNKWTFVALVIEPGKARIYMHDGQQMQFADNNAANSPASFGGKTSIGRDVAGGTRYFKGMIDDVRIWNYSLSAADIEAVYRGGKAETPNPSDGYSLASPEAVLSWQGGLAAMKHDVYFGTDAAAVGAATTASAEYADRTSQAKYNPPGLVPDMTYYWRVDEVLPGGDILKGLVWRFRTGGGLLLREVWKNITGDAVSALTSSAKYPDNPDTAELISSFELPKDWADNYGTQVRGYITPQTSGDYNFWIAGDDNCELWLSTDSSTANQRLIARVPGYTNWRQWDKFAEQKSAVIPLVGGRRYFVRSLQKEGTGGDNMSVAWQGPDCPQRGVIEGRWLSPVNANEAPVFQPDPITVPAAAEGVPYSGTIAGTATDPDGNAIVYSMVSGPSWLKVNPDGLLFGLPANGNVGDNYFVVRATDTPGEYDETIIGITVNEMFNGLMGLEDLAGFVQNWMATGCDGIERCGGADIDGSGSVDLGDAAVISANWTNGIEPDIEAKWDMNNNAGDILQDNYGSREGQLIGTNDLNWAPGRTGNSLYFDGVDDYVRITGYKGILGSASRTISAWIKSEVVTGTGQSTIISWGQETAGCNWWFRIDEASGRLAVGVWGGCVLGTTNIIDNRWHHVAAVMADDGSPSVDEIRLYVDGIAESTTFNSTQAVNTTGTEDVLVGAADLNGAVGYYFSGFISDVKVYNSALSDSAVADLAR